MMSGRGVGTSHCAPMPLQLPGPLHRLNMAPLSLKFHLAFLCLKCHRCLASFRFHFYLQLEILRSEREAGLAEEGKRNKRQYCCDQPSAKHDHQPNSLLLLSMGMWICIRQSLAKTKQNKARKHSRPISTSVCNSSHASCTKDHRS